MSSLINAILPASMQTKKEGGSSASHPLAKPAEEHTPAHHHGSSSGEYDPSERPSDMSRQQGLVSGGKREATGNEIGAGSHGTHGNDRQVRDEGVGALAGAGAGTGVAGAGLREHERERGLESTTGQHHGHHGHHNTQGGSGLETRDGYAAARQAGALPDREDIRKIDREGTSGRSDLTGAAAGAGLGAAAAGAHGHQHHGQGQSHGLTAGDEDPVAVRGQAPIGEPIHDPRGLGSSGAGQSAGYGSSGVGRDTALGGAALGGTSGLGRHQGGEYGGGQDAGLTGSSGLGQGQGAGYGSSGLERDAGLAGATGLGQSERGIGQSGSGSGSQQDGLIHGHHTTMTGEALDPHIGGEKRL